MDVLTISSGRLNFLRSQNVMPIPNLDEMPDAEALRTLSRRPSGGDLGQVTAAVGETTGIQFSSDVYAPLADANQRQVKEQAGKIKNMLVVASSRSALYPNWAKTFWREVGNLGNINPRVTAVLNMHGYVGNGVGSNPRVDELKSRLSDLENLGALAHTSALYDIGETALQPDENDTLDGWVDSLPPDLKRAGPEIFSSFKTAGCRSCRDWINQQFPLEKRSDPIYSELFNLASLVDFRVKEADGSHARALALIACDDTCEVALRRIASYVHMKRTGDRSAAEAMLAIKPTTGNHDVAPAWLVSEAGMYSQSEFKRRQRAKDQGHGPPSGANSYKGGGKQHFKAGRGKGGGKKGSSSKTQG